MIDLLKRFVVVGGDPVAPMVAATIANSLRGQDATVILIEPDTSFFGAASLTPQSIMFHRHLGIPEPSLVGHTAATFKLATEFRDWVANDESFLQPYGQHGSTLRLVPFHHYAVKARLAGDETDFNDYSMAAAAARLDKFEMPDTDSGSIRSTYDYGLHVDVDLYAGLFRAFSEQAGVRRIEGQVTDVSLRPDDGFIDSVQLDDGTRIDGDFFIDCSGASAIVAEAAADGPFEDWSQYLPCDRSVTVSLRETVDFSPITRVVAKKAGWLQRIQLRNRSAYEFLYSADSLSDDEASASLVRDIGGSANTEVSFRHFSSGVRRAPWRKNGVAIGDAAGRLGLLEISGFGLAQTAVVRLMSMLPDRRCDPAIATEYNRLLGMEHDNVRDYLCLFYASTRRDDSGFWARCRDLTRPASLEERLSLFASHGRLLWHDEETFSEDYWISALLGLGHWPRSYHPLADVPGDTFARERLARIREQINEAAQAMQDHRSFLLQYLSKQKEREPSRSRDPMSGM